LRKITTGDQLLNRSRIEGRVVDLVFARKERPRLGERVGEQVRLLVQILAVEPQQATEVCRGHHEDGIRLVTKLTVHLAGAMPAGLDAPVFQNPQSTVVDALSRIETGRECGIVRVQMAIEEVSQHRPAAVGIADEEGCFHFDGSSGQFHNPGTVSLGNSRHPGESRQGA
jgi:hypothetical protein